MKLLNIHNHTSIEFHSKVHDEGDFFTLDEMPSQVFSKDHWVLIVYDEPTIKSTLIELVKHCGNTRAREAEIIIHWIKNAHL